MLAKARVRGSLPLSLLWSPRSRPVCWCSTLSGAEQNRLRAKRPPHHEPVGEADSFPFTPERSAVSKNPRRARAENNSQVARNDRELILLQNLSFGFSVS